MGRVASFVLGGILILLGINSLFGIIAAPAYMTFIVGGVGVIIMLTNIVKSPSIRDPVTGKFVSTSPTRPFYNFIRRWVFGAFLILSGLGGLFSSLIPSLAPVIEGFSYGTWPAGAIITFIGIIYFFSAFMKTRTVQWKGSW